MFGRGSDEEAEKIFRALIVDRPEQPEVHHALGVLLQFRKKPDEAAAELAIAAKFAPEDAVIQRDTGQQLLANGRAADALPYLAIAFRLWPDDVETCVSFLKDAAEALVRCGDAKKAGETAQRWFTVETECGKPSPAACLCLAQTRAAKDDDAGALAALAVAGDEPDVVLLRAALLVHAK